LAQTIAQLDLDIAHRDLKKSSGNWALLAGALQARKKLCAIKHFPLTRALDHHDRHLFDALICGESAPAPLAFPASTNRVFAIGNPRLNNAVIRVLAKWADHGLETIYGVSAEPYTLHSACGTVILAEIPTCFHPVLTHVRHRFSQYAQKVLRSISRR
jgi:hypothetical protein